MDFSLNFQSDGQATKVPDDAPFRLLVMGNFSGNAKVTKALKPWRLDLDNLDEVISEINPKLALPLDDSNLSIEIEFNEIDDFHPDALFDRLELFQTLKNLRGRLKSPESFTAAAAELAIKADEKSTDTLNEDTQSSDSSLDGLLGKNTSSKSTGGSAIRGDGLINSLLRSAVDPYVIPSADPRQEDCLDQVNAAIAGRMRQILSHPDWQDLEATWRGVEFLLSNIEMDERIEIFLLDIDQVQFIANYAEISKYLRDTVQIAGENPWSLIISTYQFGMSEMDSAALMKSAKFAASLNAPFINGGYPEFCLKINENSDPDEWSDLQDNDLRIWNDLREKPESSLIGLTFPRFLARQPYGDKTDAIDRFDFDELDGKASHDGFLWCPSSFLSAVFFANLSLENAWDSRISRNGKIGGLPMAIVYEKDGRVAIPCAEAWLTDRAVDIISEYGFSPIVSIKNEDAVYLRLRSLKS